jgi:hypothetical protein
LAWNKSSFDLETKLIVLEFKVLTIISTVALFTVVVAIIGRGKFVV